MKIQPLYFVCSSETFKNRLSFPTELTLSFALSRVSVQNKQRVVYRANIPAGKRHSFNSMHQEYLIFADGGVRTVKCFAVAPFPLSHRLTLCCEPLGCRPKTWRKKCRKPSFVNRQQISLLMDVTFKMMPSINIVN